MYKGTVHCSVCGKEFGGHNAGKALAALRAHKKSDHPSVHSKPVSEVLETIEAADRAVKAAGAAVDAFKAVVKAKVRLEGSKRREDFWDGFFETDEAHSKVSKQREDSRGIFD